MISLVYKDGDLPGNPVDSLDVNINGWFHNLQKRLDEVYVALRCFEPLRKRKSEKDARQQAKSSPPHWGKNLAPNFEMDYFNELISMYAKAFVNSIHLYYTTLKYSEFTGYIEIEQTRKECLGKLETQFPGLKFVRDSIAHEDERQKGLAVVKNKTITLNPDDINLEEVAGEGLFIASFAGSKLIYTGADGGQYTIEINRDTFQFIVSNFQKLIDVSTWMGDSKTVEFILL